MTFTDILVSSSKSFRCASVSDGLNKLGQHRRFKQLNASILNLFSRHQQEKLENSEHSPNLQPLSDASRSITFASVFEDIDYEKECPAFTHLNSEENEDLVIVVPNKYLTDESDADVEPYPFRSEIPSCSFPQSASSTTMGDAQPFKRKFLPFHRPKKLRHPLETTPINRSKSEPFMFSSDGTSVTNNQTRKLSHRRLKLPSFTRFLQTFIKHPNGNRKRNAASKCSTFRKYSEMIY